MLAYGLFFYSYEEIQLRRGEFARELDALIWKNPCCVAL